MEKSKIFETAIKLRLHQAALAASFHVQVPKNPIHLALGHELACITYLRSLQQGQLFCLTHRNIHFNLGLALLHGNQSIGDIILEITGKRSNIAGGQLGSMNLSVPHLGGIYTSSILANSVSVAAGAALSLKNEASEGRVSVVIGDGAIEEGRFWEILTLAGKYCLPCDFYIEDNGWSMQTSLEQRRLQYDYKAIAKSFNLQYAELNFPDNKTFSNNFDSLRLHRGGSRLLQVKVETLGGQWVQKQNSKRYINYHSNKIMCSKNYLIDCCGMGLSETDLLGKEVCEEYFGLKRAKAVFHEIYDKIIRA